MFATVRQSLEFMTPSERRKFYFLSALRALNGLFDLLGVLVLGYLATSVASFLSSGANLGKQVHFSGLVLPALTANLLPAIGISVVAIFTAKAAFAILLTHRLAIHLASVESRAAKSIADNIFDAGLTRMTEFSREEVLFAIQVGSGSAFNGVLNSAATVISEGFLFAILFASFVAFSPWATLGLFVFLGAVAFTIQYFVGIKLSKSGAELTKYNIQANVALHDLYGSFREASVLGKTEFFKNKLFDSRKESSKNQAQQTYLLGMPRYIIETALVAGIFAFGYFQSFNANIAESMSTLGVFLTGGFRILAAMLPFQAAFSNIRSVSVQASRAHTLLKLQNEETIPSKSDGKSKDARPISVEFQNVYYKYPKSDKMALEAVSFKVEAGNQVALIGPSGAGKSTIADLLLGLAQPSEGHVLLNSRDAFENRFENAGSISYVPQRTGIVSGSIANNVALGIPESQMDQGRIEQALEMAGLLDLVETLPNGIHSDLGSQSDNLSGGQLQRLGLARAFYVQPQLIVLDEATSGLDAESESWISESIKALRGTVTVVLIAHKLNTVQNADQVLLVEDGTIRDSGSFQEVAKRNDTVSTAIQLLSIESELS